MRQIDEEGWSADHDNNHQPGELARAAAAYAIHMAKFHDAEALGAKYTMKARPDVWPWDRRWWKPKNPRRDLVRAAALIVAEIERLDRVTAMEGME